MVPPGIDPAMREAAHRLLASDGACVSVISDSPAASVRCRPETESTCTSPAVAMVSRAASATSLWSPVISARAMPADGCGNTASIRAAILEESWDEDTQTLCEHLGGGGLDASLLALPLREVVPASHPRMVATAAAIADRLGAGDGLLYRYRHDDSPDGIPGDEGAFVLCSFWLVDNLAGQGRVDEAEDLYDSLCARASSLGLLSEQIDPATGELIGNFPQAFSHIGVIASGATLARARAGAAT